MELKGNKDAESAIDQILKKKYPSSLIGFDRPILLVRISYDKGDEKGGKKHHCKIIEYNNMIS